MVTVSVYIDNSFVFSIWSQIILLNWTSPNTLCRDVALGVEVYIDNVVSIHTIK